MNHLMIYLETMSKENNAAIFQIAAAFFDPKSAQIGETFSMLVSLDSCVEYGLTMDVSTILWWMEQSDDSRYKANLPYSSLAPALGSFVDFINRSSSDSRVQPWGNGATFDLVILKSAFQACNIHLPWRFYNERDVRTVVELGRMIGFDPKKQIQFKGTKHEALDDCLHQIEYVSAIVQRLIHQEAA